MSYLSFEIPPPPIISSDFFADSIFEVASWSDPGFFLPSLNTGKPASVHRPELVTNWYSATNPLALPLSHSPLLNSNTLEINAIDTTAPSSSSEHTQATDTAFSDALSLSAADLALLATFSPNEAYAQTGAFQEVFNEPLQLTAVDGPNATQLAYANDSNLGEASLSALVPVS